MNNLINYVYTLLPGGLYYTTRDEISLVVLKYEVLIIDTRKLSCLAIAQWTIYSATTNLQIDFQCPIQKLNYHYDQIELRLLCWMRPSLAAAAGGDGRAARWLRWVSSTPFGIPFCLPVQFQNRGSSTFIIFK